MRSPVQTSNRSASAPVHDLAKNRTVSAATQIVSLLLHPLQLGFVASDIPLVWQSSLKNGGSQIIRSNAPFSSAGNFMGASKSYGTNSLKTPKRESYSRRVTLGEPYSPVARRFLIWMKTLGAETTAMREELVAPERRWRASVVAVASLYYLSY